MSFWSFVRSSLRQYWRTQLGVMCGVAIATAVLVGALVVGDSVRETLASAARARIGRIDAGLLAGERLFADDLEARLAGELEGLTSTTLLQLKGLVRRTGGEAKAGIVDVYGIRDSFFALSPSGRARPAPKPGKAILNARLARQLGVEVGETVLVRVEKPSAMPRDMILSTIDDISLALRVEVESLVDDADFGRFSLRSEQVEPFNLFLSLPWLQKELEIGAKANALFAGASEDAEAATARASAALARHWDLRDAELYFRDVAEGAGASTGVVEATSSRIFLDTAVVDAARAVDPSLVGLLTYFVNGIESGKRATPYSMVSAVGTLGAGPSKGGAAKSGASQQDAPALRNLLALVEGLGDGAGDLVANAWLQKDLQLGARAPVSLRYFVMGPKLALVERTTKFTLGRVVKLEGAAADRGLIPDFPGLADSEHCRDWEPGIPVDLDRIRDADEEYWDAHRGTPKAFIPLARGRELWANRFGELTSIRGSKAQMDRLRLSLRERLTPGTFGFFFRDLRSSAIASGTSATDFGGLFLALSFFLIFSAILLAVLLFVFGVEQRAREVGALRSLGFTARLVRRLFTGEAVLVACAGAILGIGLGLLYTRFVLWGLATIWKDAVHGAVFELHLKGGTIAGASIAGVALSVVAIRYALRKAFDRPAVQLLKGASWEDVEARGPARRSKWIAIALLLFALLLVGYAMSGELDATARAGTFSGAGFLLLGAGIFGVRAALRRMARASADELDLSGLARRNVGRRLGRSLATIALLASGTFLVVSVQANRLRAPEDTSVRASGSGGFAFVGRTTIPVARDLTSVEGREAFGLEASSQAGQALEGAAIVPLRVRDGDDASCLNLSLPQNPRLFGVRAEELARREAFVFAGTHAESAHEAARAQAWKLLDVDLGPDVVPAIGDAASVTWTLHKSLGDDIEYHDESGEVFKLRIVGTLQASILQGSLVIADAQFRKRFPSASGFQSFLIDAPRERRDVLASTLTDALEDVGLELVPTEVRLRELNAVQNTYLLIFQLVGALGLLLGSAGLGMVVLRNVLERRSELALLSAIGFDASRVRALIVREHLGLVLLGVLVGLGAALVALTPSLVELDLAPLLGLCAAVALSGLLWVVLATWAATRGPLLPALRED